MKRLLPLLFLLPLAAPAQTVDTVRLPVDSFLTPTTFLLRGKPAEVLYYFPGNVPYDGHRGMPTRSIQRFPDRDSLLRFFAPMHTTLRAVTDLSRRPAAQLIGAVQGRRFALGKDGPLLQVVDADWAITLPANERWGPDPKASWHRLDVLSVNDGYKMIVVEGIGCLLPLRDGSWRLRQPDGEVPLQDVPPLDSAALRQLAHAGYPPAYLFRKGRLYGLRTPSGRVLVPARYTEVRDFDYITAARRPDGRTDVYLRNGDPAPAGTVQAFRPDGGGGYSIATADGAFWIDREGRRSAENPFRTLYCGTYTHATATVRRVEGYYLLSEGRCAAPRRLCPESQYADLRFLDSSVRMRNNALGFPVTTDYFRVTLPNGLQSIASFHDGKATLLLPPARYTFDARDADHLRFTSGGRVGFFPGNKNVRYAVLGPFDKGFARYRLPGGGTGWVSEDGQEYPDR